MNLRSYKLHSNILFVALIFIVYLPVFTQPSIEKLKINKIVKITFDKEIDGYEKTYKILIKQPTDHFSNSSKKLIQCFYLSHRGFNKPTVVTIIGYGARRNRGCELADQLDANHVYIAYRYFGNATPAIMDWSYMNVKQAAADHHEIINYLKQFYTGPFITRGGSKGGTDALYHKMFYPDDVDATVVFFAPLSFKKYDDRINKFIFNDVATEKDRQNVIDFQSSLCEKKDSIKSEIQYMLTNIKVPFTKFTIDDIFKFALLEYPFSFWQWSDGNKKNIPGKGASAKLLAMHLSSVIPFIALSDPLIESLSPAGYQMATQFGYYEFESSHLTNFLNNDEIPSPNLFNKAGVDTTFTPMYANNLKEWLDAKGNNIIYIYGENDPWTAAKITPSSTTNSLLFVIPNGNHTSKLKDIPELYKVEQALTEWINQEVVFSY